MQETIYVGLDLGSSRCQQAVIDGDGSVIFSRIVPTSEQQLRSGGSRTAFDAKEDPRDNASNVALDEALHGLRRKTRRRFLTERFYLASEMCRFDLDCQRTGMKTAIKR